MRRDAAYHAHKIRKDVLLILLSLIIAMVIRQSGILMYIVSQNYNLSFFNSFISGMFFTSLFTTPLSIVAFVSIAQTANIIYMALWGAVGAVIGDQILFIFIKDKLAEDISFVVRAPRYRKIRAIFKQRIFRWLTPLIGAIVIASPFPDELGIAMMGLSHMRTRMLIIISFTMNFIGILMIGLAAHAF